MTEIMRQKIKLARRYPHLLLADRRYLQFNDQYLLQAPALSIN